MRAYWSGHKTSSWIFGVLLLCPLVAGSWAIYGAQNSSMARGSNFLRFSAPAGNRPATAHTVINGIDAAVLPNGRLVTPAGTEVNVQAPKPFGLALSPDGTMLATVNSGAAPFSLTLISHGMGPKALRILKSALAQQGRHLRENKRTQRRSGQSVSPRSNNSTSVAISFAHPASFFMFVMRNASA